MHMTAGLLAPGRPAGNRVHDCDSAGFIGRRLEMEAMRQTLAEAFAGIARIPIVRGAPDAGKTALAEELGKETKQRAALFCRRNFNQYQQEFPNAALRRAMRCLPGRMRAVAAPVNIRWRERILATT